MGDKIAIVVMTREMGTEKRSPAASPGGWATGYCISGRLVVRIIDTGGETRLGTGNFFKIPPGHDAYVEGAERVELILFAPPDHQH